jgi:dipeptidyl aminopeptidase/acylaminoacyl peptidase
MFMRTAPYGSWESPITSEAIVRGSIRLDQVEMDGDDIYWIEGRPQEAGRRVIVRARPDGSREDVTPQPFDANTRVHEYGGGAFAVRNGVVVFSNMADQRLYRIDPGSAPRPLTPATELFYADAVFDPGRRRLVLVREDQRESEQDAVNVVASVDLDGGSLDDGGQVLVSGNDFYASPRLSADGSRLCWLTWNHPNMPWDGTELWVGSIAPDGSVTDPVLVAGGLEESIFQPEWSPDGSLIFVSDRSGWWNLYRWDGSETRALAPMEAEFGQPSWHFRQSTYTVVSAERIICSFCERGQWTIGSLDIPSGSLERVPTPFTEADSLRSSNGMVAFIGASPAIPATVFRHDLASGETTPLQRSQDPAVAEGCVSVPQPIEFATEGGLTAHGFYYPPTNSEFEAPPGERPPLVVLSHGGPTGATSTGFSLPELYWTSRGFAVLDVNYGGSTGYGRAYRQRLDGRWGIVDLDDCIAGADHLVGQGLADGDRLTIRGWSASGYTTLAALTFRDRFKAGASHFGVSDLEALALETHKFESRYLDRLIGPYPEAKRVYEERSPIHFVDRLSCALILFQGTDDKVVPANQAKLMYEAVKAKGLPVALVLFEGERHGFRQAANIRRSLDAELYFLGRVLGFTPAGPIEPVDIANL